MKNVQINNNPTAYFLQQASNPSPEYREKINKFVEKLLNLKSCVLCKVDYNFTDRIPRILIHCGHTFCSACLKNFHKNRRVRCPMCLKLIKGIDTLDRLPVNHTIFSKMAEECKEDYKREFMNGPQTKQETRQVPIDDTKITDPYIEAQKKLMATLAPGDPAIPVTTQRALIKEQGMIPNQFDINNFLPLAQQGLLNTNNMKGPIATTTGGFGVNGQGYADDDLEYCDVHTDRVKHFYCLSHKTCFCRVCKEILHIKADCVVIDLYDTEVNPELLNDAAGYQDSNEKNLFNREVEDLQDEIEGDVQNQEIDDAGEPDHDQEDDIENEADGDNDIEGHDDDNNQEHDENEDDDNEDDADVDYIDDDDDDKLNEGEGDDNNQGGGDDDDDNVDGNEEEDDDEGDANEEDDNDEENESETNSV